MSIATVTQKAVVSPAAPAVTAVPDAGGVGTRDYRALVGALFAVHRRVVVRRDDGAEGPAFCTCGDVWPCRNEELAATVLDFPL